MIISQDERRGKTNAVLSDFTSIIHPLNAARTMRTKMACVKRSPWATRVKRLSLKNAGHFRRRAPVRWTAARALAHLDSRALKKRREKKKFCLSLIYLFFF